MREPDEQSGNSSNSDLVIAADLGGTNLRAATIDRNGQIHERTKHHTPKAEKPDEIVRAIVAAARECESRGLERGAKIRAVSVVVPGTVQVENGVVTKAPNVPSLNGFRLAAALESELQWPAVLENDANAAAVGEMWQGRLPGTNSAINVMAR